MSIDPNFNHNSLNYPPTAYPLYYPPLTEHQIQMLYYPQQVRSNAQPYYPQQTLNHISSTSTSLPPNYTPRSLIPSYATTAVPPSASPQKRTQMTIDSRDISTAYIENLAEKFPDLEKLIITFWDTSYKIQNSDRRSEATSQIEINLQSSTLEHTELTIDSNELSDEYLTTLVQKCLNLDKLIITNPFSNKKINYAICRKPRVIQSVRAQTTAVTAQTVDALATQLLDTITPPLAPATVTAQTVDALTTQLQALQLDTTTPPPVAPATVTVKQDQPIVINVEIEEEKRLKKRQQLLQNITEYTKEHCIPEHLKNSPSRFLQCMMSRPRNYLFDFLIDQTTLQEVFLEKEVKEFKSRDLHSLFTCCKTLYPVWKIYVRVLANALPKSICSKPPVNIEQLASMARNEGLKGSNKIYKTQYSIQESIAITETVLRSFTTLDMRRSETPEANPNWLQPFIKFYPNITRVHLPFFQFTEEYGKQLQKFSKLKALDMSLCISKHADGLKYVPQLTHLYNQYPFEQCHTVIQWLNDVESTPSTAISESKQDHNSIGSISPEEFESIHKQTNKMQQLAGRKNPTEKRLNKSKHLVFHFNAQTIMVFNHLTNLQVLNLGAAPAITKKTLKMIGKLRSLQELYIFNASQISNDDLGSLAKLDLKRFSIVGWTKITDAGVEKILTLFPKLTELWIGNNQITTYSMKLLVVHSTKSPLQAVYVRQPLSIEKTKEYYDIWNKYQDLFVHLPVHI